MRSRGADRPDDDTDLTGKSRRRFGRGRPEPDPVEDVSQEETGWLDDLRSAKQDRSAIGPGAPDGEGKTSKSGRVAPGPRDDDDAPGPAAPPRRAAAEPPVSRRSAAEPPAPPVSRRSAAEPPPPPISRRSAADSVSPSPAAPVSGGNPAERARSSRSWETPSGAWDSPVAPTSPGFSASAPTSSGPRRAAPEPTSPGPRRAASEPTSPGGRRAAPEPTPPGPRRSASEPTSPGGRRAAREPSQGSRGAVPALPAAPTSPGGRRAAPEPGTTSRRIAPEPGTGSRRAAPEQPPAPPYSSSAPSSSSAPRSPVAPGSPGARRAEPGTGSRPIAPEPGTGSRRNQPEPGATSHRVAPEPGATSRRVAPESPASPWGSPPAAPRRPEPGRFTSELNPDRAVFADEEPGHGRRAIEPGRAAGGPTTPTSPGSGVPLTGNAPGVPGRPPRGRTGPVPRPDRDEPGTGRHSGEFPQAPAAGPRSAGPSRPVSAVPEGTSFGSRNTGRVSRGVANPESYRGGPEASGRHGTVEPGGRRTGPLNPPPLNPPPPYPDDDQGPRSSDGPGNGRRAPGRGTGAIRGTGAAGTGSVRASAAVVPPVVPGRQGARTPAVPGRAGAMADSPSGVIQRPGEGTGRVNGRGTGRVPRPGSGRARPGTVAGTATGRVRPSEPGDASGRVRGVDPDVIASGRVQPIVPDATAVAAVAPVPDLDVRPHPEVDQAVSGRVRPPSATARAGVASARVATVTAAPSAPLAPAPVSPARVRPAESSSGAFDAVPAAPDSRRAELRTRMRAKRRLRVISLVSLSVVVLALLPLFFGLRAAGHDPVYTSIDALGVPGWAAQKVQDKSSGSRWCFLDCPLRERTAQSQQAVAPTGKVYATALERAGWLPWKVSGCPDQPIDPKDGVYSCWKRDEFTLDLWVKRPDCAVDQVALSDPAVIPSDGIPKIPAGRCTGSAVSIKVQNAIADTRGQPDGEKPGLVGETPDPVLTDDPLLPTPSPS